MFFLPCPIFTPSSTCGGADCPSSPRFDTTVNQVAKIEEEKIHGYTQILASASIDIDENLPSSQICDLRSSAISTMAPPTRSRRVKVATRFTVVNWKKVNSVKLLHLSSLSNIKFKMNNVHIVAISYNVILFAFLLLPFFSGFGDDIVLGALIWHTSHIILQYVCNQ